MTMDGWGHCRCSSVMNLPSIHLAWYALGSGLVNASYEADVQRAHTLTYSLCLQGERGWVGGTGLQHSRGQGREALGGRRCMFRPSPVPLPHLSTFWPKMLFITLSSLPAPGCPCAQSGDSTLTLLRFML